jgi:hypothetical protein
MNPSQLSGVKPWTLPPLILHPFTDPIGQEKLLESSRAHLVVQGFLPLGDETVEEVRERLIEGRLYEIRMLYYLGKDLERWVGQCAEVSRRESGFRDTGLSPLSFIDYLVQSPPAQVKEKLQQWGVIDPKSIFSRAFGFQAIFAAPPDRRFVSPTFIEDYYKYADQLFACRMASASFTPLAPGTLQFDLYASGEYARMLERQWEGA